MLPLTLHLFPSPLHLQSFVLGQKDWGTQHGLLPSLYRCTWQNQELCFSYSCSTNPGQFSLLRVTNVMSHMWGGHWRLEVFLMCNRAWILISVPSVVPPLGILAASACSWITYTTWCEFREPQSKALLWVRRCSRRWLELRLSCACGHSKGRGRAALLHTQPGRSTVCIPGLLRSIRPWLLPATCAAPADEEELLPPPQCFSSRASRSCCSF